MRTNLLMISYFLFFIPLAFIVNFLFQIIPLEKIQGLPVFFPIIFCPIGLYVAWKVHKRKKDALSYISFIANSVLFLFPLVYMILGTIIFGV